MVDQIRDVGSSPFDPSSAGPDPEAMEEEEKKKSRAKELISRHRVKRKAQPTKQAKDEGGDAFSRFAQRMRSFKELTGDQWSKASLGPLKQLIEEVISEKTASLAAADKSNAYAVQTAANNVREQMRKLMNSLSPPPEISESPEMMEIKDLLWPPSMQRKGSSGFDRGSAIKGTIKREVMDKLVNDAVQQASKRAGQKMLQMQMRQQGDAGKLARMSLEQLARAIKRKKKKVAKGKYVDENGELVDVDEEEREQERRELMEMMELFSAKALETMKVLREEIAPQWAPEQQPWLLHEADRQVYDILLATADPEILAETQAWDDIQDLRKGDTVFTLRAADKLTEAAARGQGKD